MAPPKSPWKKANYDGTRGLVSPEPTSPVVESKFRLPSATNYAQEQDEEIEVLKAIYMDDYEEIAVKGAWNRNTDRAFKVRIRSISDPETSVVLAVKTSATYPKSLPLLNVEGAELLRPSARKSLDHLLRAKPPTLLGEVMVHTLASDIQDLLEDVVQTRDHGGTLPSLEDERAVQEAAAEKQALEEEAERQKRQEEQAAEEARLLQQMVENERRRQEEQQKRKSRALSDKILSPSVSGPVPSSPDIVWFDHAIDIEAGVVFNGVKLGTEIRTGNVTDVTVATAIASHPTKILLVVKKFTASPSESVNSSTKQENRLKRDIQAIETELSILKKLRYPSIISVLDYKIETDNGWNITILTEFGNAG